MDEEKKEQKKDYGKLVTGIAIGGLTITHILAWSLGFYEAWGMANNRFAIKEQYYLQRGFLTENQMEEAYNACFGPKK